MCIDQSALLKLTWHVGLGDIVLQLALRTNADVFLLASDENEKFQAVGRYRLKPERVFTTASSLAQTVKSVTGGRGLDFVFKVSSGLSADIAVQAVSKLGKVFAFGESNATVQNLDEITKLLLKDDTLVRRSIKQADELLQQGTIQPWAPVQIYDYSDMKLAFESAENINGDPNIVLELRATDTVPAIPGDAHKLKCRPDATYILVGGLGGVGRWLALKLAQHGAKHIAFLSRSGAKTPEAQACLQELADLGVDARAYACDIGDTAGFAQTLQTMNTEMPPVKGAVHGAMRLWDTYLKELPYEGWSSVTELKIQGGLNMHNMLPKDMDFLVFISSLSPIMGQAMQANYSAG